MEVEDAAAAMIETAGSEGVHKCDCESKREQFMLLASKQYATGAQGNAFSHFVFDRATALGAYQILLGLGPLETSTPANPSNDVDA